MKVQKIVSYLAPGALTLACLSTGWSVTAHAFTPDARAATQLVVTPEYKEGELLVKFKNTAHRIPSMSSGTNAVPEVDRFESMHKKSGKARVLSEEPWRIARLKPGSDTVRLKERLARHPDVESVELNYRVSVAQIPNDPRFSEQWSLHNIGQTGGIFDADVDAPEAWNLTTGSNSVVVAVIDSGVDYTHEDLRNNMWINAREIPGNGIDDDRNSYIDDVYGYDFFNNDGNPSDDSGHGTHVAGIIAAAGNNGVGITGLSWSAKIMAVKFLGADGKGYVSDAVDAIHYATTMGAKVLNNSWEGGAYSQALYDVIAEANTAGVLFVAAAGNEGTNTDLNLVFPAGYDVPNVVSVSATGYSDDRAYFSNFGKASVDLAAPGLDILSTVPRGSCELCDATGYRRLSGTSMAAPHVAGTAALILSQTNLSPSQLRQRLMGSADRLPSLAGLTMCGGRLNTDRALRGVTETEPCVEIVLPALPDLALSNLTGPVSVKAGGSVSVNIQLENLGGTAAPWAFTMFALSSNPILNWDNNPQGYRWLGYHYVQPFAPGNTIISVVFNVPNATTPGTYYLQGVVDSGNAVREFNENNNTSNIIQMQVLAP